MTELDDVINSATFAHLCFWVMESLNIIKYISIIFKMLFIVFIIYHFYKRQAKNICSSYFYILFVGFVWDIFSWWIDLGTIGCYKLGGWNMVQIVTGNYGCLWIRTAEDTIMWYSAQMSAIWTLMLSVNRLSAILWLTTAEQFWSRHLGKLIGLLHIFPVFLNGWSFLNYNCRFGYLLKCDTVNQYWSNDAKITGIGAGIISIISLGISIATAIIYRLKIKNKSMSIKQSPDKKLILHSMVSTISFMIYTFLHNFEIISRDYTTIWTSITLTFAKAFAIVVYHFSTFFFLFLFSSTLRKQFFAFYHLSWLQNFQMPSKNTITIPTASATLTSSSIRQVT